MYNIKNTRSVSSNVSHAADRQTLKPRSAVLSRRELRRIVAEMLG